MKELWEKIKEALVSTLPVTAIVYILALTPFFDMSRTELITFTIGAVMLVFGIGMFSLGADLAMTPMGTHVGSGLSKQKKLGLLLGVLGMIVILNPLLGLGVIGVVVGCGMITAGINLIFLSTSVWLL